MILRKVTLDDGGFYKSLDCVVEDGKLRRTKVEVRKQSGRSLGQC